MTRPLSVLHWRHCSSNPSGGSEGAYTDEDTNEDGPLTY